MMIIKNNPFPHIIIDSYFTTEEYSLIWKELDFLLPNLQGPEEFGAATNSNGEFVTNSSGLTLDSVYSSREVSNILKFSNKIFDTDLCDQFSQQNEYWDIVMASNVDYTKVRCYKEGDSYDAHQDLWVNAIVSTTISHDKFIGGDLFFPNHNFTIKSENNRTIIFPGWVKHGITKVVKNKRFAITKFIHCTE